MNEASLYTQVWAVHIDLVPKRTACKMGGGGGESNFRIEISHKHYLSQMVMVNNMNGGISYGSHVSLV